MGNKTYHETLDENQAEEEGVIASDLPKSSKRDQHSAHDAVTISRALRDELAALKQILAEQGISVADLKPIHDIKKWMIEKNVYVEDIERFKAVWDSSTETSRAAFLALTENDGGAPTEDELNTMARIRAGEAMVVLGEEIRQFRHFKALFTELSSEQQTAIELMMESGGPPSVEEVNMLTDIRTGKASVFNPDDIVDAALSDDRPNLYLGADGFSHTLVAQQEWSLNTFGPSPRTAGVIDHIRKELGEVESNPYDLMEWIDIATLAIDGFWRHGGNPLMFTEIYTRKLNKNFGRMWPDWRTLSEDQAIEHDRSGE